MKRGWESHRLALVGTEQHAVGVDGGDGADGAVDEWGVAVAVAGVEQHPVAGLVVGDRLSSRGR